MLKLDADFFGKIFINDTLSFNNLYDYMKCLYIIEPLKQCHVIILQKLIASILQKATFKLHDVCTYRSGDNKHMIIAEKNVM